MRVSSRIIKSDEVEWYVRYILTISKIFFWLSVTLNSTEEGKIAKGKQNQNKKIGQFKVKNVNYLFGTWGLITHHRNSHLRYIYLVIYTMPYAN